MYMLQSGLRSCWIRKSWCVGGGGGDSMHYFSMTGTHLMSDVSECHSQIQTLNRIRQVAALLHATRGLRSLLPPAGAQCQSSPVLRWARNGEETGPGGRRRRRCGCLVGGGGGVVLIVSVTLTC